ncbi:hypothetical protein HJC23_007778 [Cyclotella cryptica]|uniref:PSP proline-rich domain-containing protein n=1 Tax=Cyclotella cryptica TaxID=29204 RepID=A0ABD3QZW4_9STRA|eukprot:CCRYP_000043-RA/>CCRYP_000043-RA protein AED:0.02 eAED:0.02 QI:205/1/1/1/1/1/2/523/575
MALTTAERNKRKRERKKREREQQQQQDEPNQLDAPEETAPSVEIEYVAELPPLDDNHDAAQAGQNEDDIQQVLRRFQSRSAVYVTEDEDDSKSKPTVAAEAPPREPGDDLEEALNADESIENISKRKLKSILRPSVSELKQRVTRPELVEAHDVTAPDPEFLVYLKGLPGTVPVPRHWGRKRKYLQGKRGVEKAPFALPDFIVKTGICSVRDATKEDEEKMSIKQKNRMRVSGKGGTDVDYRTLYDAFFRHQTKPKKMTNFGDLYYEGKEYETAKSSNYRVGFMSETLREALGMPNEFSPPPWLINMQRFGPPPSYPNIRIPGLNAPLPAGASYGYHVGGWGKPPIDAFGRPLYGGDPFGTPEVISKDGGAGEENMEDLYGLSTLGGMAAGGLVTSDGKALGKKLWGAMPSAYGDGEEEEESDEEKEESSEEEESSSEEEEEEGEEKMEPPMGEGTVSRVPGMDSVLPDGVDSVVPSSAIDLRKPGDETPMVGDAPKQPRQLYTVLQQTSVDKDAQATSVFASDHAYVLPGAGPGSNLPEGMGSVLSKAVGDGAKRARKNDDDEDADDLGKKFKF